MDKEVEVNILLWQFLEFLENDKQNRFWVHPINQKRNISGFIHELRDDPEKLYNYCRMNMSFYELLSLVQDRIKKLNIHFRRSIPAEERLLITIRYVL